MEENKTIELLGIECNNCNTYFFIKNETGKHYCPKCEAENERYIFSEEAGLVDVNFVANLFENIQFLFSTNGLDSDNLEIMALIESTIIRNKEDENVKI